MKSAVAGRQVGKKARPPRSSVARPTTGGGARRALRWVTAAGGVAAAVVYLVFRILGATGPGSPARIAFGIAAAATLAIVVLYSVRRAMPSVRRLGRTRYYLDLHVYAGSLFVLLFALHTNFGAPAGVFSVVLWIAAIWVVVTGALGVALQRMLPKLLDDMSTLEVPFERIPALVAEIRSRAEVLVGEMDERVRVFYARELSQELSEIRSIAAVRPGRTVSQALRSHEFDVLRGTLDAGGAAALEELQALHGAKLDLDRHFTMQSLLRGWLYLHVPASMLLLVLVGLHVFFVLYF